jgi:hypothetical protein
MQRTRKKKHPVKNHLTLMKYLLLVASLIASFSTVGQQLIKGQIIDQETKESLPFATISFDGTTSGTVSNAQGYFQLQVPADLSATSINISYIGYNSRKISISQLGTAVRIGLTPSITQLEELVVLPLTPEEYIKKAVRKYGVNYAKDPFTTTAYYREVFTENQQYITFNEGVFYSSYPDYQDTSENQHQLALYRSGAEKDEIDFMRSWVEKKTEKEKKKAVKKGEEWDEEENDTREIIQAGFGGPEEILKLDLMKDTEYCLDTTNFKKFRYSFGKGLTYQGRDIMEILFESRGQVDNQKMQGVIHIDIDTDAIVNVSYSGKLVIPVLIKPILFAFGLSIKDPVFNKSLKYQYHEGRWYPDTFQWDVALGLKKRYAFKPNEFSAFTGHQIFKVNDLNINDAQQIAEEKRFDPDEEAEKQINPIKSILWSKVNTLPLEQLESSED